VKSLGDGQSTKFFLPFELTKIVEGVSEYLGISRETPAREISDVKQVEEVVGKAEDILGPIPSHKELRKEIDSLEEQMENEKKEIERIAEIGQMAGGSRLKKAQEGG